MQFVVMSHVENRRLFAAAAGAQRLEEWERQHVHNCEVCQGVFYVFIRQIMANYTVLPQEKPPAV